MVLFDATVTVVSSSTLELKEGLNKFNLNFKVKAGLLVMKIVSAEKDFGASKIVFK